MSTWLTHIARHHTIDVLRSQAKRLDQYAVSWDEIRIARNAILSEEDPQESAAVSARRTHICDALAHLPDDQKQILALAYFGGYTQRQIAEMLRQPLETTKTHLRLAMQKLRDFLQEERVLEDKSVTAPNAHNISEEDSQES